MFAGSQGVLLVLLVRETGGKVERWKLKKVRGLLAVRGRGKSVEGSTVDIVMALRGCVLVNL